MTETHTKLIFVYNANSGFTSRLFDLGHKLVSPSTYPCSLCTLTHGLTGEKQAWKYFQREMNIGMAFLHKDEFEQQFYPLDSYPAILKESTDLVELMNSQKLNSYAGLNELIHDLIEIVQASS